MVNIILTIAPIISILIYFYYRDKYEKEPFWLLIYSYFLGMIATVPIYFLENIWSYFLQTNNFLTALNAAVVEEMVKFAFFFIFLWKNKNFNEKFDGIIYSVYIALGMATIENFLYVFVYFKDEALITGILRGLFAVPSHTIDAVFMGYYLAKAKFDNKKFIFFAIFIPILVHFGYDFILLSLKENQFLFFLFLSYFILLLMIIFTKIKAHSEASIFKN